MIEVARGVGQGGADVVSLKVWVILKDFLF